MISQNIKYHVEYPDRSVHYHMFPAGLENTYPARDGGEYTLVELAKAPKPAPTPAPKSRTRQVWTVNKEHPQGALVDVPDPTPLERAMAEGMKPLHRKQWNPMEPVPGAHIGYAGEIVGEIRFEKPEINAAEPPPLDLVLAILDVYGVDDDNRTDTTGLVAALGEFQRAVARMPYPHALEPELQTQSSYILQHAVVAREYGVPWELLEQACGRTLPRTKLWRASCSVPDRERAQREERQAAAKTQQEERAKVVELLSKPSDDDLDTQGFGEIYAERSAAAPTDIVGDRGPDYVFSRTGVRLWRIPRVAPHYLPQSLNCRGWTLKQGKDKSEVPRSAIKPAGKLTEADIYRFWRLLEKDATPHIGQWTTPNLATRKRIDELVDLYLDSHGAATIHYLECIVRGCENAPSRTANAIYERHFDRLLEADRQRQLEVPHHVAVRQSDPAMLRRLQAEASAVAITGYVRWGACKVSMVDAAGGLASSLFSAVKSLLAGKTEPVSTEALATALQVPLDSKDLHGCLESLGWTKVRKSTPEGRQYLWVLNS